MALSQTPFAPRRKAGDFDHRIAAVIREARLAAGLTQADLGQLLGVTFQQVQKYEKGTNRVPASAYPVLIGALGLSPQALLDPDATAQSQDVPPFRNRASLELVRLFETLTPDRRALVLSLTRALSREPDAPPASDPAADLNPEAPA